MARDPTKLTKTDARTFALLAAGPLSSRQTGALLFRSPNTALRSLQRLVLHGLATAAEGERKGFATGSPAFVWTLAPGAVFPGVAPRKKYTPQRTKAVPVGGAQSIGLAGLVQQMASKD